jgi:anti-sigma factor RsiW
MSADVEHLTCREFVEVLTDYLDNALDPAERAEIERHIVICRGCSNYVEQMRSTIDLLGRLAGDGAGDVGSERLLSMFRAWQAGRA